MEMFQAQDVQKVAFKPPPPPVQEVQAVQSQDITPIQTKPEEVVAIKPPKSEDVVTVKPQGQISEIPVVVAGGSNQDVKPLPNAGLGDFLGDLFDIIKVITKEDDHAEAPSAPKEAPKKETPKPAAPKVETPTVELPKEEPTVQTPKEDPKAEEKPIPASGRTFKTQGDPIVKTGDGLQYSLNEPGKYVSLQSKSGDFRMEQEVQETAGGRHYNTAMGFKVGSDTIKFDTDGGSGPATMTINGKKVDLKYTAFSQDLPGGGKLSYDPKTNKVNITSPEGDKITVNRAWNDQKTHYLNASVELSEKRPAGSVFGVLGTLDADNDAKNDARMRDGSVFKGAIGDLWKTPEAFAKEWRTQPGEGIL